MEDTEGRVRHGCDTGAKSSLDALVRSARQAGKNELADKMVQCFEAILKIPQEAFQNEAERTWIATIIGNYMGYHSLAMQVADAHMLSRSAVLDGLLEELYIDLQNEIG